MDTVALGENLFATAHTEEIELRVYTGFAPSREFGATESVLPSFEAHTIEAIIVPLMDSAPTEDESGRSGRVDQIQQIGGKRTLSTANFLLKRSDITFTRTSLAEFPVKIVYEEVIWDVSSIEFLPVIYQITASTEFQTNAAD